MAASSRRRWSSGLSCVDSTLPATATAVSAAFSQISARAWSRAVAMSRWARCRAASASVWASLTICVGGGLGVLAGLVEDRADLVGGAGHLPAVLGEQALALVAGPLGLLQHVLEVPLPLMQGRQQRFPGEPAQQEEQAR